jgi:hypothetical protein
MSPTLVTYFAGGWVPVNGVVETNDPPTTPTGLSVTALSSTSLRASWTASTDPDGSVAGYQVRLGTTLLGVVTGTSYTITGLAPSTSYTVKVRAVDDQGAASADASASGSTSAVSDYPDAGNTGVPAGTTLSTGWFQYDFYGSPDGKIWDGYDITCVAPLEFPTSDNGKTITFRNCRFRDGGVYWLVLNDNAVNVVFEHCTFLGMGLDNAANDAALNGSNITMRYCDVSHTGDGMKIGSSVLVENSYFHDLTVTSSSHNDCVQSLGTGGNGTEGSGATFRHCTFDASNGATCVTLSTGSADSMKDLLFEDCLLSCDGIAITGGYQAGTDVLSKVSDIVYRNNKVKAGSHTPVFTSIDSPVVVTGTTWYDGPNAGNPVT